MPTTASHKTSLLHVLESRLTPLLLGIISFSFVFKVSFSTVPMLLLLVLNIGWDEKEHSTSYKKLSIIFLAIYLMYALSNVFILEEPAKNLGQSLALIFIPILFYFKKFTVRELQYFTISFLIFQFLHILYIDAVLFKILFIDKIENFTVLTQYVEKKFIIERPYFSLNCLLAIVCLKHLYEEKKIRFYILLLLVFFIILSLFLAAARLAMGVSVMMLLILVIKNKIKPLYFLGLFFLLAAGIFTVGKYSYKRIILEQGEPRIVIWKCAYDIIKAPDFNYLTGAFSTAVIDRKLNECYASKEVSTGLYWWISKNHYNYNTHNQFLGFFASFGLIGLSLLLGVFVVLMINYFKTGNIFSLLMVVIFFSQCIFENILYRQLGIYLFLWFSYIFLDLGTNKIKQAA